MNIQTEIADDALPQEDAGSTTGSSRAKLSIIDLLQIARTRKGVILLSAAGLLALVMLGTFSITPLYKGVSVVMLNEQQTNVVDVQLVMSGMPTDQVSILDQMQILQSRQLAERVIYKLHLDRDPEFNTDLVHSWTQYLSRLNPLSYLPHASTAGFSREAALQHEHDRIVAMFEKRLGVVQKELSTTIEIDFESRDPVKAKTIADAVADAYIDDQLTAKFEATRKATEWLQSQLSDLATKARMAEAAAAQFKADHHITDIQTENGLGTISVLDQQTAAINTQLIQAKTDRTMAEATLARVRALVAAGRANEVSQVVNSPLIGQLRQQQATLVQQQAQLASRYGASHPKMLDLVAEQHDLQKKIDEEISHIVASVQNDVSVATSRENTLHGTLKSLEVESAVQAQDRVKLAELLSNATSSRALYDSFVARSKETEEQQGLQIPDARIISRSIIPTSPSFPNFLLVFGGAVPVSILFGFVIAFLLERLDNGFRVASRAEQVLGLPVLATVPNVKSPRRMRLARTDSTAGLATTADLIISRPLSSYAEAIRGLQMGLSLSNVDRSPHVVVTTSAVPGEGKSTVSLSLARLAAQMGHRTVIVDCDLRRPNIYSLAKLSSGDRDLVDVLRGSCTIEKVLVSDVLPNLSILPVIKHVKNAPDLLASNAMATTVQSLREMFDFVVIDSAPILPVNDTKVLVRLTDAVLFIVRWETTPRDAASEAIKALRDVHAPIAGVVLSRADVTRHQYYSYGYGSSYGKYLKYYDAKS